jgi:uncharacterized protein (UPF0210 family)
MNLKKIVRSICYFTSDPHSDWYKRLHELSNRLEQANYEIQTKRVCFGGLSIKEADAAIDDESLFIAIGSLKTAQAQSQFEDFLTAGNISFNLDITAGVSAEDLRLLFDIIAGNASKTFNFTYTVNAPFSSPYFPSASYEQDGFAIGLQSTDLSANCDRVDAWLENMQIVWQNLLDLFAHETDFIGIDSSIAPLFAGDSSFVEFIKRVYKPFSEAVTTDIFTQISSFIKTRNPRPIGLCGLMFPCLEDAALAQEYEQGDFSIERNIFLSLHSGLGIDTYPIAIDENPRRVLEILQLVRALSIRYQKPLSARFISDGKAKIGHQTDFQNPYLQDVVLRKL